MLKALKNHWREYLMEAWGLGTFMISACVFGVVLFSPNSPLIDLNATLRNVLMGAAMGTTAIGIFLSPWGRRSGAHINPAVTLTFWRLGKVNGWDALFYVLAQFAGGTLGVFFSWMGLGKLLADSAVNFVVTVPGSNGAGAAFAAEVIISFSMMMMVLVCSNAARLARLTPFFAGILVALYISLEAPVSGMSMNPARSFGSAVVADYWNSIWIYFVAPPLAMLLAAEIYVRVKGLKNVFCAKFYHYGKVRCIFNCRFGELGKNEEFIEVTKQKHLFPTITQLF
ncbi:MAG TPA: aquaporin [Pyrinomonadaceae bacterium]|nr:aquaporin [Pyrinomonadaceae bacterium]